MMLAISVLLTIAQVGDVLSALVPRAGLQAPPAASRLVHFLFLLLSPLNVLLSAVFRRLLHTAASFRRP